MVVGRAKWSGRAVFFVGSLNQVEGMSQGNFCWAMASRSAVHGFSARMSSQEVKRQIVESACR